MTSAPAEVASPPLQWRRRLPWLVQPVDSARACLVRPVCGAPLWAWLQLFVAVCAVSTAGAAFLYVKDVPPFFLAGWRLQLVTLLISPACALQWRGMPAEQRSKVRGSAAREFFFAGVALACHFGGWVSSTQLTSLPHALLFVSMTPVVLALYSLLRRVPLSRGELAGTALATLGAFLVVADHGRVGSEGDTSVGVVPSAAGDLSALFAAAALAVYLTVGSDLRAWCPTFVYAAIVNAVAATLLTLAGVLFESGSVASGGAAAAAARTPFGYLRVARFMAVVTYLAVVPGVVGHVSFNMVQSHISPLVITLALTTEPVLGSLVGMATGLSGALGALAFCGGATMLGATVWVVTAEAARKRRAEQLEASDAEAAVAAYPPLPADEGESGRDGGDSVGLTDGEEANLSCSLLVRAKPQHQASPDSDTPQQQHHPATSHSLALDV